MARFITFEQINVDVESLPDMTAEQRREILLYIRDFREGICKRLEDPEFIPAHLRDKVKVRVT